MYTIIARGGRGRLVKINDEKYYLFLSMNRGEKILDSTRNMNCKKTLKSALFYFFIRLNVFI